ncbi:MAG: hypothetical protein M3Q65_13950 [Chloroflexota bacterium]|nr:hypothetical protein [Chloroflexota bacterium]
MGAVFRRLGVVGVVVACFAMAPLTDRPVVLTLVAALTLLGITGRLTRPAAGPSRQPNAAP